MHPTFPTLELDIVIQNFEVHFGLKFVEGMLRIKNALLDSLD